MREYVSVKELIKEVDAMAKRGTFLTGSGVKQEDLAMQISGLIFHVATKEEMNEPDKKGINLVVTI